MNLDAYDMGGVRLSFGGGSYVSVSGRESVGRAVLTRYRAGHLEAVAVPCAVSVAFVSCPSCGRICSVRASRSAECPWCRTCFSGPGAPSPFPAERVPSPVCSPGTRRRISRLVKNNVYSSKDGRGFVSFVTLTFRGAVDLATAKKTFRLFRRLLAGVDRPASLRSFWPGYEETEPFRYVLVYEPHAEGGYHLHLVSNVSGLRRLRFWWQVAIRMVSKVPLPGGWVADKQGFYHISGAASPGAVNVKYLHIRYGVGPLVGYITKYVTKHANGVGPQWRKYSCSNGLKSGMERETLEFETLEQASACVRGYLPEGVFLPVEISNGTLCGEYCFASSADLRPLPPLSLLSQIYREFFCSQEPAGIA